MAVRTARMNPAEIMPRMSKSPHLFRKMVLLVLLTAAYALGVVLVSIKYPDFPQVLFNVFADSTLAVVAGFGSRLLLAKRNWFIRSITAGVLPVMGMAILGYFSDWKTGIDVIALSLGYVSWTDLSQLVLGVSAAWAALWAWHHPAQKEGAGTTAVEPHRSAAVVSPRRIQAPQQRAERPAARASSTAGLRSRSRGRTRAKLVTPRPAVARAPKRFRLSHPHVQLALVEEHRCPYCLEPVLRTDPRGVKECEVCHSLHHADCWAITGTCQVPHLNS